MAHDPDVGVLALRWPPQHLIDDGFWRPVQPQQVRSVTIGVFGRIPIDGGFSRRPQAEGGGVHVAHKLGAAFPTRKPWPLTVIAPWIRRVRRVRAVDRPCSRTRPGRHLLALRTRAKSGSSARRYRPLRCCAHGACFALGGACFRSRRGLFRATVDASLLQHFLGFLGCGRTQQRAQIRQASLPSSPAALSRGAAYGGRRATFDSRPREHRPCLLHQCLQFFGRDLQGWRAFRLGRFYPVPPRSSSRYPRVSG